MPGDDHLPELLDLALHDRLGDHVYPPLLHRPQEVGAVADPDSKLAFLLYGDRSPHAGCALDCCGVDAAVHHAPRRMVVLAELDKAPDPASANLVEAQSGNTHELAASSYDRSFAVIVGHGFVPSYVAARVYFGTASITPGLDPRFTAAQERTPARL